MIGVKTVPETCAPGGGRWAVRLEQSRVLPSEGAGKCWLEQDTPSQKWGAEAQQPGGAGKRGRSALGMSTP